MITSDINLAIESLKKGNIIAIPTETVYGLAGNAFEESSVNKIFKIKNRPSFNPLIVHIPNPKYINKIAQNIPKIAQKLSKHFWPGPLTLVLEKQTHISDIVTAGKSTVAVRVPNHKLTLDLLSKLPFPLVAPSANPFGFTSPTSADHVIEYFADKIDLILDGGISLKGIESTIIGFENKNAVLYRHGSISIEEIEKIIGKVEIKNKNNLSPEAPGMLKRHYAPKTKIVFSNDFMKSIKSYPNKKIGILCLKRIEKIPKSVHQEVLSSDGNLNEAAKNLYSALHKLDRLNLDLILTSNVPEFELGRSINDRLRRAVEVEN